MSNASQPQHEHEFEHAPGLPEPLPAGERILWQGRPQAWRLAVEALHIRKLALYFALLLGWRALEQLFDPPATLGAALASWAWTIALAALALGFVVAYARMAAEAAVYTITDRRVVMRIGVVLTVTFNLPFTRLAGAALRADPRVPHSGDIALELMPGDHIAYLHLWPHARPWKLARPQPALRCLADAPAVARILAEAMRAATQHTGAAAADSSTASAAGGALPPRRAPRRAVRVKPLALA
jgi:hypothetical protein